MIRNITYNSLSLYIYIRIYIYIIYVRMYICIYTNIPPAPRSPLVSGRHPSVWHRLKTSSWPFSKTIGTKTGRINRSLVYLCRKQSTYTDFHLPSYPSHQFPPSITHDTIRLFLSLHDCLQWNESIFYDYSKYSTFKYMMYAPSFKSIMKKEPSEPSNPLNTNVKVHLELSSWPSLAPPHGA